MFKPASDAVHWYLNEIGARLVAKTGIPSDRHHLGKLIMQGLKDDQDFVMQIDGATGQSETNGKALERSIRCAIALKNMGLKKTDVMVLMGPNHLDFCVPHNAALYLGVMVACIDMTLGVNELKSLFHTNEPNIIFCQNEKTADIEKALSLAEVKAKIVTYDEGSNYTTLAQLLEDKDDRAVKEFLPTDFDPETTTAYLTLTSGSSGVPKTAVLTHNNFCFSAPYIWNKFSQFPIPTRLVIMASPAQWLSAGFHYLFSPILKYTRLQTSAALTPEHFTELVNKYKPSFITSSPTMMTTMASACIDCDFTCFEWILLGGSAVSDELIEQLKVLAKTQYVFNVYGMSEVGGPIVQHDFSCVPGSCGRPTGGLDVKLVNPITNEDVTEPNVPGELLVRGPALFKGYYNNPEVTSELLTEDGWLKTGDIFYRDESWNMFFVDRIKMLLKYRNHQVAPIELETVIMRHPGVLHVAVTGIPDRECGDLPVACVEPKPGCKPTAQEIKDLVKESLTDSKQLRGGVIFMEELPLTSTSKINRNKLKEMVRTMERE